MDENEFSEWDDENWLDSDTETLSCPECGAEIYDDVEICPQCGFFVETGSAHALAERPSWFVIVGILGILAVIVALSGLLNLI